MYTLRLNLMTSWIPWENPVWCLIIEMMFVKVSEQNLLTGVC